MNTHTFTCKTCNKINTIPRVKGALQTQYCNRQCWNVAQRVIKQDKTCVNCSVVFTPRTDKRQKYCTKKCNAEYNYKRTRTSHLPYTKFCEICEVSFTTKRINQTICLSYECKEKRYRTKYKRYDTKNPNDYKEKEGYLYCMYNKEYNVYKVGITYDPNYRVRNLKRCGFVLKTLYKFKNKHEARLAEQEFYIQAESMGISPNVKDRENNKFFHVVFKSYAGKTEIIYGEMIKYYELKKMLDSLMGEEISQAHKRLTYPV